MVLIIAWSLVQAQQGPPNLVMKIIQLSHLRKVAFLFPESTIGSKMAADVFLSSLVVNDDCAKE